MNNIVPCFVCGKALDAAYSETNNQPHDATAFRSAGHYGSTFFDPMSDEFIEVAICDEHLKAHIARICHGTRKTSGYLVPLAQIRGYTPEDTARAARSRVCPDCNGHGWRYDPTSHVQTQCKSCYYG